MELPIFFLRKVSDAVITLDEDTSRHVVQVLRMKKGEKLQLTDGAGNLLTADILDDHKKKCTVQVVERSFVPKQEREVCIAISLLKNSSRFEWFLEKATEIGVTEIIPLLCSRTEKQHFRYDRMKQIIVSAMIQSKQVWLPVLREPTSFEKACSSSMYQDKLIAHCIEDDKKRIAGYQRSLSVQALIGPEGDFTKDEISHAIAKEYIPITLGDTRLRAETAGMVAATLLCI